MPDKRKQPKPVVIFCEMRRPPEDIVNISSQNGAEGVVTRKLPKSHVSHVILNANVSEDRFLDMKVSSTNRMRKKSMDVHDHFINTFIKRLERKQQRWIKEDNYVSKNLHHNSSARVSRKKDKKTEKKLEKLDKGPIGRFMIPTPPLPAQETLYKTAKYPYIGVNRVSFKSNEKPSSPKAEHRLPRIQTAAAPAPIPSTKLPQVVSHSPPWGSMAHGAGRARGAWGERADSASTMMTHRTAATAHPARSKRRSLRGHDHRFAHLISELSPIDAMQGPTYYRARSIY